MNLLEIFKSNLLREFSDIQDGLSKGEGQKIATVVCSPYKKKENLRKLFSFILDGTDVFLISEEQSFKFSNIFWKKPQEHQHWGRILLLTSGTSGTPRIIVHTLEELLKNTYTTLSFYQVSKRDIWPLSLPLYHIGGLQIALRCLLAGIPLVSLDERFYCKDESFKATILSLVPVQLHGLFSNSKNWNFMKKMRAILVGGSPLSDELWMKSVEKKIPLSPTYGLTEMGSQVAAISPEEFLQGKTDLEVLPGRKVRICHERVIISGIGQMLGIFEKGLLVKSNKEISTQDRGAMKKGRLKISGRWDRVIISGGKKIYPQSLELLLAKHSAITEAVLVGLPDEKWGEKLHLAYTGRPGLVLDDIRKFLRPHVASWEVPKGISYCGLLPLKGTYKTDYRQVVELVQQELN